MCNPEDACWISTKPYILRIIVGYVYSGEYGSGRWPNSIRTIYTPIVCPGLETHGGPGAIGPRIFQMAPLLWRLSNLLHIFTCSGPRTLIWALKFLGAGALRPSRKKNRVSSPVYHIILAYKQVNEPSVQNCLAAHLLCLQKIAISAHIRHRKLTKIWAKQSKGTSAHRALLLCILPSIYDNPFNSSSP